MTYLVLARKWRPRTWDDVVAQDHVTSTLRNAIQHNRLAHAYLFTGPRGVGKTSAARILAKSLNCEQESGPKPCNECSSCIEIAESRNVDVFEIDGASNRGIDEVRNLRENIQYAPARGRTKIYIIDEVHMLTPQAFNALLKTLEEPPSHVLFIFATTEPHKVPATIVSRCQRFDFRRIGTPDIKNHLERICQKEKIDIADDALFLIAKKADGSLRDSQSILDQIVSYTSERISADHVIQGLGLIEQELFFEVTDVLVSKDVSMGLALVEKIVSGGYDIEEFLIGLSEHLRNFLIVRSLDSTELIDASEEHRKRYEKDGKAFGEEDILRLIRIVTDTLSSAKRSLHPRLPLELAMVKMIKLDRTVTIEDLLTRLESLGERGIGENPGKSSPIIEDKANPALDEDDSKVAGTIQGDCDRQETGSKGGNKRQVTLEEVQSHWDEIIDRLKHRKITLGSFLQEGSLLRVEDNTVEVGFGLSNGFHIDAIMRSKSMVLEEMKAVLESDVQLRCVKRDMPHVKPMSSSEKSATLLKSLTENNPKIKKIVDDFDAEIVD